MTTSHQIVGDHALATGDGLAENGVVQSDDIYERSNLTRLQMLYWVGHKLRPEAPIFNSILIFTIFGDVDRAHFDKAFAALLEHTDALRTVIEEVDGIPQQRVVAELPYQLEFLDFSEDLDPRATFQTWLKRRSVVPLSIESRLFDSALVKLSESRYVWYCNQHHIITDASSFFLTYDRLAQFYRQAQEVSSIEVGESPSFQDYIDYERNYRTSAQYQRAEAYWQNKLVPGPEPMRFYGQSPIKKTTRVKRFTYDLGPERSAKLRAVAREKGIFTVSDDLSLYNIFAALFWVLLYQMTGNRRLGFVTPVHNRFRETLKNTVGLIMEICPFQVEIEDEDTFASLIGKVKRETRETMLHYQYGSGLSLRNDAFDVMFNTHHMPLLELGGVPVEVERIHPGHGSESLVLHVNDMASTGNFQLHFDFHLDVFDEQQREDAVHTYVQFVDTFLQERAYPIKNINPTTITLEHQVPISAELDRSGNGEYQGVPQDILEFKLTQIWEELLEVESVGLTDNFFDLGGNSWLAVRLFVQIEKVTGQYLPLTTLLDAATITDLARCIRQEMGETLWSTLITIQPGGDRRPLFCVPGAGGNGLTIARIARYLSEDQPVYMFQIPLGDGEGSPPFTRIEEMAAHYVEALRKAQPEGPYLLAGYSAGGLIAFEVAQQLRRQDQQVSLLAVIDVAAQSPNFKYVRQFSRGLGAVLGYDTDRELQVYLSLRDALFRFNYFLKIGYRDAFRLYTNRLRRFVKRLYRFATLERQEKLVRFRRKLEAKNAEPKQMETELDSKTVEEGDLAWRSEDRYMQEYFEINNIAVKTYMPQAYPGRIILFKSVEGYQYAEQRSPDPLLGWGKIANGGVERYMVPGNHMQMVREPNVRILGEQLNACLDEVQAND